MGKKEKIIRERFSTTLDPNVRKRLEYIRIDKGFTGVNDVIEYITKFYDKTIGGNNNEDNNIKE